MDRTVRNTFKVQVFRNVNLCRWVSILDISKIYLRGAVGAAQSVQRLATGWTVRGSNPGGGEIFRTRPDRLWGPASLLYNGYRILPGGKSTGTWR